MRLLFLYAQLGEPIEDFVSLYFQLPRQLVDPNLLHRKNNLLVTAIPAHANRERVHHPNPRLRTTRLRTARRLPDLLPQPNCQVGIPRHLSYQTVPPFLLRRPPSRARSVPRDYPDRTAFRADSSSR